MQFKFSYTGPNPEEFVGYKTRLGTWLVKPKQNRSVVETSTMFLEVPIDHFIAWFDQLQEKGIEIDKIECTNPPKKSTGSFANFEEAKKLETLKDQAKKYAADIYKVQDSIDSLTQNKKVFEQNVVKAQKLCNELDKEQKTVDFKIIQLSEKLISIEEDITANDKSYNEGIDRSKKIETTLSEKRSSLKTSEGTLNTLNTNLIELKRSINKYTLEINSIKRVAALIGIEKIASAARDKAELAAKNSLGIQDAFVRFLNIFGLGFKTFKDVVDEKNNSYENAQQTRNHAEQALNVLQKALNEEKVKNDELKLTDNKLGNLTQLDVLDITLKTTREQINFAQNEKIFTTNNIKLATSEIKKLVYEQNTLKSSLKSLETNKEKLVTIKTEIKTELQSTEDKLLEINQNFNKANRKLNLESYAVADSIEKLESAKSSIIPLKKEYEAARKNLVHYYPKFNPLEVSEQIKTKVASPPRSTKSKASENEAISSSNVAALLKIKEAVQAVKASGRKEAGEAVRALASVAEGMGKRRESQEDDERSDTYDGFSDDGSDDNSSIDATTPSSQ